ncbi:MAG TPA: ABC transporter permease [Nocardioides sp.]|jgi:hypothetical protein|nr:ABC transporter permease [Nocardioides sp.]
MSITERPPRPTSGPAAPTFLDVVRLEWTKARTVPSTFLALALTLAIGIGLSALVSALASREYAKDTAGVRATWDPTGISTAGGSLAQLAVAVLATLVITAEYSTHEINVSLVAVPRRLRLLGAKATVVMVLAFVIGEVTLFSSFFLGMALISGHAPTASLGDPGVLRALIGGGLYVTLVALLSLGLGTILRGTAATISTLVAVLFVLPGIAAALPASWQDPILKYWPTQAGGQVATVVRVDHTLGPWTGFADLAVFVTVVLLLAAVRLVRSDA